MTSEVLSPWDAAVHHIAPLAAGHGITVDEETAWRTRNVASSPAWTNGRRPNFWGDIEVRLILTATHRQITLAAALEIALAIIGPERCPSRSAAHRYWQVLDRNASSSRARSTP